MTGIENRNKRTLSNRNMTISITSLCFRAKKKINLTAIKKYHLKLQALARFQFIF